MEPGLPESLQGLLQPTAYSHPVGRIELVTTHISWVLLTGELAYKIKRPVHYSFIDLRSLPHRAFLCQEELRLNRRFAPDLYLEVCPITLEGGQARIGGPGEPIEYALKMRQFPAADELHHLLEEGNIQPRELRSFGRQLAVVHAGLAPAMRSQPWGQPAVLGAALVENLEECGRAAQSLSADTDPQSLREPLLALLTSAAACISQRFSSGYVRECHGDLHTGNLVRTARGLLAFDCLEFDPALRWIDVADEVGFLVADLQASEAQAHASAFLGGYLDQSGDFEACRVLNLYKAHRSLVRAKVLALIWAETSAAQVPKQLALRRRYLRHLACARAALEKQRPRLVLMAGVSGSGKTWLAERLAPLLGAIHLRSDIERKRLAGIGEHQQSHSALGQGLYSAQTNRSVYEHLAGCARHVLGGGFTVIVDATFQRRADRAQFYELAAELGVQASLVHCYGPRAILERRIAERAQRSEDPSEADVSVMRWQIAHFESVDASEPVTAIDVSTQESGLAERLALSLRSS